mgnify:CR=1 FL=1
MNDKEKIKELLKELTELSEKYGLFIQGCGCCGSPWIFEERAHKDYDNLVYTNNGYIVDDIEEVIPDGNR